MNPIQLENANAGTPDWQLTNPATNREIEGYASLTSVNKGENIDLFVNTQSADASFKLEVFRTGWYGGAGARLLKTESSLPGQEQDTPEPDENNGMLIECNWKNPYTLTVPSDWVSGIYLARLTKNENQKQSYIIFVVRDDSRASDLVFQSSFTTFQAYNFWPGNGDGYSLYEWGHPQENADGVRARKVSFNRPYVLGNSYDDRPGFREVALGLGAGEYLTNLQPGPNPKNPKEGYQIYPAAFEYNMVRWLEKKGYDVTYITNLDLHENPGLLLKHKGYLSVGHNEYWSMEMRKSVEDALKQGVNLGFFSSNTLYWQIRLDKSDITGQQNRTMICYKDANEDPERTKNPQLTTVEWRSDPVNRPEAALLGVEYVGDPVKDGSIVIANASHWLLSGTGLKDGDSLPGLLGYEVDTFVPGISPDNTEILAISPASRFGDTPRLGYPPGVAGQGKNGTPNRCNSSVTLYSTDKALVFATGSMQWSWGLDDYNAPNLRPAFSNPKAEQITANLLASFIDPMTITLPSVLPAAAVGKKYEFALFADGGKQQVLGGTPPYVWSVAGQPRSLGLTKSGASYVLGGLPSAPGSVDVTISVTDAQQQTASIVRTMRIQPSDNTPRALGINFVGQGTVLAPDKSAGVVPKANWNNALGPSGTLSVADESGLQNGAVVTWTADNLWSLPLDDDDNKPANACLMKGYLDTGRGNPTRIDVSGLLPAPKGYDVYVYVDGDNDSANRTAAYSLSGPGFTASPVTVTDSANTNFSGAFQQANNSPGNYVKFSGIKATAFTLTATSGPGSRAPVNAIQFIPSGA